MMASYKRWGPKKPTGGRGYFPPSPGTEPSLTQFHGMLEAAIALAIDEKKYEMSKGMRAALWLYEGYFGVYKSKEE